METSKIDVLALASPRLAMVTARGCVAAPDFPSLKSPKARLKGCAGCGRDLGLFKSRSGNRIPPAVTEQIGRRPRNVIGRKERRQVRAFLASKDDFQKSRKFLDTSQASFLFPSKENIRLQCSLIVFFRCIRVNPGVTEGILSFLSRVLSKKKRTNSFGLNKNP